MSKYALLIVAPILVKPLDFTATQRRALHLRLKGLWGLPVLVAGVWASLVGKALEWAYGHSASSSVSAAEALQAVGQLKTMSWMLVTALTVVLLYAISVLRWGFHCTAIQLARRRWPELNKPGCLFFIVNTSGWGMWAAIYGFGLLQAIKWWVKAGQPAFVADASDVTDSVLYLMVLCGLGGLLHLTTRNNVEGMRALYGGHRGLSLLVRLAGILLLILLGSIALIVG